MEISRNQKAWKNGKRKGKEISKNGGRDWKGAKRKSIKTLMPDLAICYSGILRVPDNMPLSFLVTSRGVLNRVAI